MRSRAFELLKTLIGFSCSIISQGIMGWGGDSGHLTFKARKKSFMNPTEGKLEGI